MTTPTLVSYEKLTKKYLNKRYLLFETYWLLPLTNTIFYIFLITEAIKI